MEKFLNQLTDQAKQLILNCMDDDLKEVLHEAYGNKTDKWIAFVIGYCNANVGEIDEYLNGDN